MLKYLLFYFLPLLHYMDILLHSWQSLKLTFLGISYLLFARNNCGKIFFKEFQGLLVTRNLTVWKIRDSIYDFYDVKIPKKMSHHTYFLYEKNIVYLFQLQLPMENWIQLKLSNILKTDMNYLFPLSDIPQQSQQEYSKLVYLKSW